MKISVFSDYSKMHGYDVVKEELLISFSPIETKRKTYFLSTPIITNLMMSTMQRTMPHALSMDRLIWAPNSDGLNCCVPRMM